MLLYRWFVNGYLQLKIKVMNQSQRYETINTVISTLQSIDVDGETLEFIIQKLGMDEQILRQLYLKAPDYQVDILREEKYSF
jgi:hypothetical protein